MENHSETAGKGIILTIIVPMYNAESRISGTIEMLHSMSDRQLEFILVDDGSADKTLELAEELTGSDDRFHVISAPHGGVSSVRNIGIDAANGQYLMFLDDDDRLNLSLIHTILPDLSNETDLYLFSVENIWPSGYREIHSLYQTVGSEGSGSVLRALMLNSKELNISCSRIFKRSIIRDHSISFPTSMIRGEDQVFMIRYLQFTDRYSCSDQVIYYYNRRRGSAMDTYREAWLDDERKIYQEKCLIGTPAEASIITVSVFLEIVFKAVLNGQEASLIKKLDSSEDGEFWQRTAKLKPLFSDWLFPMLFLAKSGKWNGLCRLFHLVIPIWKFINRRKI